MSEVSAVDSAQEVADTDTVAELVRDERGEVAGGNASTYDDGSDEDRVSDKGVSVMPSVGAAASPSSLSNRVLLEAGGAFAGGGFLGGAYFGLVGAIAASFLALLATLLLIRRQQKNDWLTRTS